MNELKKIDRPPLPQLEDFQSDMKTIGGIKEIFEEVRKNTAKLFQGGTQLSRTISGEVTRLTKIAEESPSETIEEINKMVSYLLNMKKMVDGLTPTFSETTAETKKAVFDLMVTELSLRMELSKRKGVAPSAILKSDVVNLVEERKAEKAYRELCAQEEVQAKRKAKKKNRSKAPALETAEEPIDLPSEAAAQPVIPSKSNPKTPAMLRSELCQHWISETKPIFADRVKRWETRDPKEMRKFLDKGVLTYAGRSDEALKLLQLDHFPIGAQHFIHNEIYSYSTPTGRAIVCRYARDHQPAAEGIIFFGLNVSGKIYHMQFEELTNDRMEQMDIFNTLNIESAMMDDPNLPSDSFTLKGKYSVNLMKNGVVKILCPSQGSTLELVPLQTGLFPPNLCSFEEKQPPVAIKV